MASVALSVAITAGGAWVSAKVQSALMEERIAIMQRDMARHEMEKGEQIRLNATRAEEHERRIVRLEANFGLVQETLSEMKEDIKIILRNGVGRK